MGFGNFLREYFRFCFWKDVFDSSFLALWWMNRDEDED